ncbi:MAG: hypothetical protein E6Q97_28235 [Desulfurellales bacterium]|nr:MAG: hypothetical protein E6Q97_28235 [Desulfurellales bacterium]
MDENHDIVFALNTAAQSCPDVLIARLAKEAAAELKRSITAVESCPSLFNIRQLNASTMRALNVWRKIPPLVPPVLPAGRMDHRKVA